MRVFQRKGQPVISVDTKKKELVETVAPLPGTWYPALAR